MAYSKEVADSICERLAEGESLRSICRSEGMPSRAEVFRWLADPANGAFRDQYARSKEEGIDLRFEEMRELQEEQPERVDGKIDGGFVQWRRLQVDALKWELSKLAPKKYGEKLDLNHSGAVKFEKIEAVIVDPKD